MTEVELQRKCNKWLRDNRPDVLFLHEEKGRGKGQRHRSGVPDLVILPPKNVGHTFAIELKVKGGRPKPDQIRWQQHFKNNGLNFYFCYSFEEFLQVMREEDLLQ